jgi:ABC-type glycerol-3-phosphate transport system substrate-binding protein
LRLVTLLSILALLAAACGGDDDSTDTTAGPTTTSGGGTETTAGGEQIDLLIWASRDYYRPPDLWAGFMAENPNINVTVQVESNDDILQQLQRKQEAGERLPDVIQDDTFLIEAYANAGLLIDHTALKDKWEQDDPTAYGEILPIAWEENLFPADNPTGLYGASLTANFDVIYYNIPVCEAAGVDCAAITTLDEFLQAMRDVKAAEPDIIPLTVQALPGTGVTTLKTFLSAAGAPYDGAVPDLQSEGGIYTLQWFLDASNDGLLPPQAISWGEDEARAAFAGQRAAFILDGFTVAGEYNAIEGFGLGVGWGVVPSPTRGDGNQISNARTWAVTTGARATGGEAQEQAAFDAIKWVGTVDQLVDAAAGGSVPMRNSVALADPRLDDIWPFFDETLRAAYAGSDSVPAGLNGGEVEVELEKLWGEIVVGTDKTAQELADQYQPILDSL